MNINWIQNIYEGSSTSFKSVFGVTEDLNVGIGLHQCSALNFLSVLKSEFAVRKVSFKLFTTILHSYDVKIR